MFAGKKILIGITGSIAAYKAILLVRRFIKEGAEVKVIMTPSAKDFVTPLTLSTLSKNPVLTDLFDEQSWSNHVMLGRWADVLLVAPLSCNTLSKMAQGACDNLLLATYLSATCPVVVAPAMDEDMWKHPSTIANLDKLRSFGNHVIPVDNGELASGLYGDGRMAEPEAITDFVLDLFSQKKTLAGKKVLITAGPTQEAIDPVRFIGNHSSGKMGIRLAQEMASRGASVTLVLGPSSQPVPEGIETIRIRSAAEMFDTCLQVFPAVDISVMSAAVADYTPVNTFSGKIKKTEDHFAIELTRTKDILKTLGMQKKPGQLLIGFALETHDEKAYALEKLSSKNADMIVLNSLQDEGAGFGHDTNKITIFEKGGKEFVYDRKSKREVAKDIVDRIVSITNNY